MFGRAHLEMSKGEVRLAMSSDRSGMCDGCVGADPKRYYQLIINHPNDSHE